MGLDLASCIAFALLLGSVLSEPSAVRLRRASEGFTANDLSVVQTVLKALIQVDQELIPDWVQMSFHDCFGSNGCNGCMDENHPGNRGLKRTILNTRNLHRELAPNLSLADFIALLGTEAIKFAVSNANGTISLPFSAGRPDCTSPMSDSGLPAGFQTNTIQLLSSQFGLSTKEAVALIGAHSLGRAKIQNTGFRGPWDRSELKLDNGYYKAMRGIEWQVEKMDNIRVKSSQWSGSGFLMLHADMILLKKFTTSGPFDTPSCTFKTCPDQPTTSVMVKDFADDLGDFHSTFGKAYLKMINKSNSPLRKLE